MSIAEKLQTIAENEQRVYETGYEKGKAGGGDWDDFWDSVQDYGKRTQYRNAFAGSLWVKSGYLPPKYPIKLAKGLTTSTNVFDSFNTSESEIYDMTEICKLLDFSEATSINGFFAHARIKNVNCDLSNCTNIGNLFQAGTLSATYIDNVTLKVSEKLTSAAAAFSNCVMLANINFTNDSVINISLSFAHSNLLTADSVDSIINALKDLSGTTAKTITFHTDVINNLTEEQTNTILAKNWRIG